MIKEYKLRQEMYHNLNKPSDLIGTTNHKWTWDLLDDEELVQRIIEYFTIPVAKLSYPSKSYAVAVIYAKLLNKYFKVPVLKALRDKDLLYGNDKFFIPYDNKNSADIYDRVLLKPINWKLPQVMATEQYFKEEFYLLPNPYFNNSNIINIRISDEEP